MTKPQIPSHWHPSTYAVDRFNKVIWKQGSHALALHIKHNGQPVPGYTTSLCTREELVEVRHRIWVEEAKRDEEPFTPEEEEELGRMFADGWMRRKPKPDEKKQASKESLHIRFITWAPQLLVGGALLWLIGSTAYRDLTRLPMAPYTRFDECVNTLDSYELCEKLQLSGALDD